MRRKTRSSLSEDECAPCSSSSPLASAASLATSIASSIGLSASYGKDEKKSIQNQPLR